MEKDGGRTKRIREQRWMFDKIIQTTDLNFFWPLTIEALGAIGLDVAADLEGIRRRVKKFVDIPVELERVALKREGMAIKAEKEGHFVTARDNYFAASNFYNLTAGQFEEDDNEHGIAFTKKKVECYEKFIEYAPRHVERVEIPFDGDKTLPGYLHLPPNPPDKVPCILDIGGSDMVKEALNPVYNSKTIERGMAFLAIDCPGQGEALLRKITFSNETIIKAGKAAMDYMLTRPEIDHDRIGIRGLSLGSYFVPMIVGNDDRYKAAAVYYFAMEDEQHTAFHLGCPAFKNRIMWMCGYENEDEFDEFCKTLTLKHVTPNIKCPILIVGGEDDEVCPVEAAYEFYDMVSSPKKIIVYENEHHGISHGYDVRASIADWLKDRLDGKPMDQSESILVNIHGREIRRDK